MVLEILTPVRFSRQDNVSGEFPPCQHCVKMVSTLTSALSHSFLAHRGDVVCLQSYDTCEACLVGKTVNHQIRHTSKSIIMHLWLTNISTNILF